MLWGETKITKNNGEQRKTTTKRIPASKLISSKDINYVNGRTSNKTKKTKAHVRRACSESHFHAFAPSKTANTHNARSPVHLHANTTHVLNQTAATTRKNNFGSSPTARRLPSLPKTSSK